MIKDDTKKTTAIKNKSIAMQLVNDGFDIMNVCIDKNNKNHKVYIFENTVEFQKRFAELIKKDDGVQQAFNGLHNVEVKDAFIDQVQQLVNSFRAEFSKILEQAIKNELIKYHII